MKTHSKQNKIKIIHFWALQTQLVNEILNEFDINRVNLVRINDLSNDKQSASNFMSFKALISVKCIVLLSYCFY